VQTEANVPIPTPKGRGETILLVEDDPALQKVYRLFIVGLGYTLLSAETPEDALRLSSQHADIDLMLTDVVMPNMNGRQLAAEIRKTHLEIKILFMSGYTADVLNDRGVQDNLQDFLSKPFSRDALANKLGAMFEKTKAL
jgi:CheY-like chemotaxis protein